jgi:ABC-type maltose transport system permease subunit
MKRNIYNLKISAMRILLYITAVLLFITWGIGFFAFKAGSIIHFLPVISVFLFLQAFIVEKELLYNRKNPTWKIQE